MKWKQFRLKTTTQAEDIVSSMLADLGIEGVQIEDKIPLTEQDKEQMFVDILPDIIATLGRKCWMPTLSKHSKKQAIFSIPK